MAGIISAIGILAANLNLAKDKLTDAIPGIANKLTQIHEAAQVQEHERQITRGHDQLHQLAVDINQIVDKLKKGDPVPDKYTNAWLGTERRLRNHEKAVAEDIREFHTHAIQFAGAMNSYRAHVKGKTTSDMAGDVELRSDLQELLNMAEYNLSQMNSVWKDVVHHTRNMNHTLKKIAGKQEFLKIQHEDLGELYAGYRKMGKALKDADKAMGKLSESFEEAKNTKDIEGFVSDAEFFGL